MTTHQFKTGTIIKRDEYFHKILGEVGEVRFVSSSWKKEEANDEGMEGLKESQQVYLTYTVHEMNAYGYVPVSPEESGLSEEWEPEEGSQHYVTDQEPWQIAYNKDDSWHRVLLKSGLLKKTKEEAEEAYKRLMQE